MSSRKLEVVLTGDSKALERTLDRSGKKVHSFGAVGVAAGALVAGGLGLAIKDVVGDFEAGEKASAQTAAVLKSTGGVANVTQGQIEGLAGAIADKSGMDDAAIQSGENMLLTFTNVRNEAGKGNDVFNQATNTLADMSAAMGTDMKTQAIQLGKALNDPIKGVGALSKVGVTFTDQQKAQIAAMVKAGDTAGAQKVILAELHEEFGGSAEAAGKTLGGQLNILHGKLDNLGGVLIGKVIPVITTLAGWLSRHVALVTNVASVVAVLAAGFLIYSAYVRIAAASQALLNIVMEANPLGIVLIAVVALVAGLVVLYQRSDTARAIIQGAFRTIKSAAETALGWITHTGIPAVIGAWNSAQPVVRLLGTVVKTAFGLIASYVRTMISIVGPLMRGDFSGAFDAARAAAGRVLSKVGEVVKGIPGVLEKALPKIGDSALKVGAKIFGSIKSGIGDLGGWILGKIRDAVNGAIDRINNLLHFSARVSTGLPSPLPSSVGLDFNPPDIPHLAKGGIVTRPTVALIGEDGPEAVTPLTGRRGRAALAGMGGITVNFHETPGDAEPRAIAAAIGWELRGLAG